MGRNKATERSFFNANADEVYEFILSRQDKCKDDVTLVPDVMRIKFRLPGDHTEEMGDGEVIDLDDLGFYDIAELDFTQHEPGRCEGILTFLPASDFLTNDPWLQASFPDLSYPQVRAFWWSIILEWSKLHRPVGQHNRPTGEASLQISSIASELPDMAGGLYGTERDLTGQEVREIVGRVRQYQKHGGKITEWHRRNVPRGGPGSYTLECLYSWLKDDRFDPE